MASTAFSDHYQCPSCRARNDGYWAVLVVDVARVTEAMIQFPALVPSRSRPGPRQFRDPCCRTDHAAAAKCSDLVVPQLEQDLSEFR
ncbi:unnamed protein product, partial [Mesorhabditis spiculigera]